jgi:hypothetical protein
VLTGRAHGLVPSLIWASLEFLIGRKRFPMTMISISNPRDGDTVREVRRALNALAVFLISEATIISQPSCDIRLQIPDGSAEEALAILRNVGICAMRVG